MTAWSQHWQACSCALRIRQHVCSMSTAMVSNTCVVATHTCSRRSLAVQSCCCCQGRRCCCYSARCRPCTACAAQPHAAPALHLLLCLLLGSCCCCINVITVEVGQQCCCTCVQLHGTTMQAGARDLTSAKLLSCATQYHMTDAAAVPGTSAKPMPCRPAQLCRWPQHSLCQGAVPGPRPQLCWH
jgi:hypothetical protein